MIVSAGQWATPMTKDADGVWRGTLTAPAGPATVALRVQVGALELRTRPRIFIR